MIPRRHDNVGHDPRAHLPCRYLDHSVRGGLVHDDGCSTGRLGHGMKEDLAVRPLASRVGCARPKCMMTYCSMACVHSMCRNLCGWCRCSVSCLMHALVDVALDLNCSTMDDASESGSKVILSNALQSCGCQRTSRLKFADSDSAAHLF